MVMLGRKETTVNGYEETFGRFERAGGFVWQWNWASFLFGPLWYLYKGMLPKAVLYFVGILILGVLLPVVGSVIGWMVLGVIGSYDLYLMHRGNTQLYDGANFRQVTQQNLPSSGATGHTTSSTSESPYADPASNPNHWRNSSTGKRKALDGMLADGLLTEAEYQSKLEGLNREDAVRGKVARLDEALKSGVITQEEYEDKWAALIA